MPPTCSTCVHHHGEPTPVDGRRECRALPPTMGRESHHGSISHPVVLATWPLTLPADHCGGHEAAFEMPRIGQEPVPGGLFGSAGVPSSGSSFKAYVPVEPEAAQEPQEAQDGPDDAADGGSPQDAARKPRKARKRPDAS